MVIEIGDIVKHKLTQRIGVVKEIEEIYALVLWFDPFLVNSNPQLEYLEKIS